MAAAKKQKVEKQKLKNFIVITEEICRVQYSVKAETAEQARSAVQEGDLDLDGLVLETVDMHNNFRDWQVIEDN